MDPFTMLKQDHKKVKTLFKEYEDAGERAYKKKQQIAEQIFHELEVHTTVEEEIFYPAIREKAGKKEPRKLVNESYEEHAVAKRLIEEMKALSAEDEKFDAKFMVLRENVEHHIKEEERELFPSSKDLLEGNEDELAERMQERKEELQGLVAEETR